MNFVLRQGMAVSVALCLFAGQAVAEGGLFSPAAQVNDRVVTRYEVAQRAAFLQILRTPGDLEAQALQALIEDRLRQEAGEALDIEISDEDLAAGLEEFAGRAQLSTEVFVQELAKTGVEAATFRDFVSAGLIWREVVRNRFGARASVSEAEIDRALSLEGQPGTVRVLLSELVLGAPSEQAAEAEAFARELLGAIRNEADFADAARQFSASPTRDRGGVVDWLPLANLPPAISSVALKERPGALIGPVILPNAVAIFLLRAVEATRDRAPASTTVDYAQFLIPGGGSPEALAEAAALRARVRGCGDLYAEGLGLPPERLLRDEQPMAEVPLDIGLELAKLDPGESVASVAGNGALRFLMLCSRTYSPANPEAEASTKPDREAVRSRLLNDKLSGQAEAYLAELMANARIVTP